MRRILLAIFMIAQAPLSGAMAAHMFVAQSDPSGLGAFVICSSDGSRTVAWQGSQSHGEKSQTGCFCPCAAACGFCSIASRDDNATAARYYARLPAPLAPDGALADDGTRLKLDSCGPRSPPRVSI